MKIKEITLYTNRLSQQRDFYETVLGFDISDEVENSFSLQAGFSKLNFKQSKKNHAYHYCFLIPSNKLAESVEWLKERLEVVKIEGDRLIQKFESWNAESVYFYDGAGNIAEFIVRYDLKNEQKESFNLSQIINFNEIGMPTTDVAQINAQLEQQLGSKLWKGNLERFGVNGTQEGLFLLVNNDMKKVWFPTQVATQSASFNAVIEVNKQTFHIEFTDGELKVRL